VPRGSQPGRVVKGVSIVAALGAAGVGALLVGLWVERQSETTLPAPTGAYAVGRALDAWTDHPHLDTLAPAPGTPREVVVWIWYPAAGPSTTSYEYLPAPWRTAARSNWLFTLLTRNPSRVHGHSAPGADVSPRERSYPVLILRGGASANVTTYSTLAEDLASHGYVVVGIDAPYRTIAVVLPDGRVVRRTPENNPELYSGAAFDRVGRKLLAAWTADIAFVLDRLELLNASDDSGRFKGRLDLSRVGLFGHSFGGAQAAQFCHDDRRCKAGVDVDGAPLGNVVQEGLHQPFMFLLSADVESNDAESQRVKADIRSIYDRLPAPARLAVEIKGSNHFTFSDDGAVLKSAVVRRVLRMVGALGIEGRRQLAVTAYCLNTFFDAYLKGAGAVPPAMASPSYPEVKVLE
jgi:predicted dienelactone hydrolase